jgi:hypothetical protein
LQRGDPAEEIATLVDAQSLSVRPVMASISFFASGMSCGVVALTQLDAAYEIEQPQPDSSRKIPFKLHVSGRYGDHLKYK